MAGASLDLDCICNICAYADLLGHSSRERLRELSALRIDDLQAENDSLQRVRKLSLAKYYYLENNIGEVNQLLERGDF